jgi:hypothetical protein
MSPENDKAIVNRLCSEIQLFDLCDRESCSFRKDRFCTDRELLAKFESIKEEDDRPPLVYEEDEFDDDSGLPDYEGSGIDESEDE